MLTVNLRVVRTVTVTEKLAQRLPNPSGASWSALSVVLSKRVTPSLSDMRRQVSKAALNYAQNKSEVDGFSREEINRILVPDVQDWYDTDAFVATYRGLVEAPQSPVKYVRRVNSQSPHFPLQTWWNLHKEVCHKCSAHHFWHGDFESAAAHASTNDCSFIDTLAWLSGEWRIPFQSIPPAGERENYASLSYDPEAMQAEIERMIEWNVLVQGKPHLIHPAMGVVRNSDLHDACRILHAIGRPSPSENKKDIRQINEHISAVLSSNVTIPAHLGDLKRIKVRLCIDATALLNRFIKKWKFPYASIHDAVRLVKSKWFMSRTDLRKFFNQMLLHVEDWPMLGVRLPKDLEYLGKDLKEWVSMFAQFGGSPFPALANALVSAVSAILRSHGIPNVFITDDIFVCGATQEECQANLDKTIAIVQSLGWKLQFDKILPPAQQMPFVGILIDTVTQRLSIPQDKLDNYARTVRHIMEDNASGRLLARDLESLIGKLGWVSEVMIAGKARIRPLRDALPSNWYYSRNHQSAIKLSDAALEALQWWAQFFDKSAHHPFWVPFWTEEAPVHCRTFSDASGNIGFGLVVEGQVYQGLWSEDIADKSSGYKELIPVLLAVLVLTPKIRGKVVIVTTDNLGNVFAINKGICKSPESQALLQITQSPK